MKIFASGLLWALFLMLQAQSNGVGIGTGAPPHPSAMLDIQDTTGGLLYPRLTTAQRNAINNPATGLTIFNTTSQCFEAYFANGWKATACACNSFPDPSFTFPGFIPANQAASFSATTGGASYAWTFASGTPASSNIQNPQVTWANTGTYTVKLVVTDNQGCADSSSQSVTVTNCPPPGSQTFSYTGSPQSFTVPACVTSLQVDVRGAQGGNGGNGQYCSNTVLGGNGGRVQATLAVSPGQVISVVVGQKGGNGQSFCGPCTGGTGGYGGSFNGINGGNTSSGVTASGGGGGGASYVALNGNNVLIAGGGGGGGANNHGNPSSSGGKGGHPSYGGNGGCAASTVANCSQCGGGGGGPGQGGQGFASQGTNISTTTGFQTNDGSVIITW